MQVEAKVCPEISNHLVILRHPLSQKNDVTDVKDSHQTNTQKIHIQMRATVVHFPLSSPLFTSENIAQKTTVDV